MNQTQITEIKNLIAEPNKIILLDELISNYIKKFIEALEKEEDLSFQSTVNPENFLKRIKKYEEISKDLQQIITLLARWGKGEQLLLIEKILSRVSENKKDSGANMWLDLQWYPIMLLMYVAGIASLSAKKYDTLKIILQTGVCDIRRGEKVALVIIVSEKMSQVGEDFKKIPGKERHIVARSTHLFEILQPTLEELLFLMGSYEELFDKLELFFALTCADLRNCDWGIPGRFYWKQREPFGEKPLTAMREEAKKLGDNWEPLKAGFFDGSVEKFLKTKLSYCEEE